jgi:hypothetical protein
MTDVKGFSQLTNTDELYETIKLNDLAIMILNGMVVRHWYRCIYYWGGRNISGLGYS